MSAWGGTPACYCATDTSQDTPNRSTNMPNLEEKKVGVSGICTVPPEESLLKNSSAS